MKGKYKHTMKEKRKKPIFIYFITTLLLITGFSSYYSIVGQAAEKITMAKIKKQTLSKEYKNKQGKIIQNITLEMPILQGNSEGIKKINKFYKNFQMQLLNNKNNQTEESHSEELPNNYTITDNITYQITYNKNGIISILHSGYYFAGGAHGSPYRIPHTFDLNSGKELKLNDIFQLSEFELSKKIIDQFQKIIDQSPDEYNPEAIQTVKQTAGWNSSFYLIENNICFYYEPYILASYARGYVEACIPYNNSNLFKIKLQ